jgi:hypothetical protein
MALFLKFWAAVFCSEQVSLPRNGSERNSDSLLLYLFHGTEFRVVFSSADWFGREFREYASIFVSTERNFELFSLPLKCSEWNSESLLLFLLNGTEFRVVFSSPEGFGTEFRGFLFRGTAGIPSEITICFVYSVFRGILFLSEIPNPTPPPTQPHTFCICCTLSQRRGEGEELNQTEGYRGNSSHSWVENTNMTDFFSNL